MIKNFNIPGTFYHISLNKFLMKMMYEHPEMFYPDVKISSVFGNFPYCIFDGGRNFAKYKQLTEEEIIHLSNEYAFYGVPIRLIFTNPEVEKKHLTDRYCNLVLDILNTGKNEVCVNSPLMEDYLRTNYPNFKLVSSTTKRITNYDKLIEELNKDYYQVCLDYDMNKKPEVIDNIPMELRPKCEFLINAICPPGCVQRKIHYSWTGRCQLTYLKEKYSVYKCRIRKNITDHDVLGKNNNFSLQEIDDYSKKGYKYFKLEGRTLPSSDIFALYLYYLVKPEYYFEMISEAACWEGIFYNDINSERQFDTLLTPIQEQSVTYL